MTDKRRFYIYQSTQPIQTVPVKETQKERFQRLKRTADATGRRFIHIYLEDERRRKGSQN